jgi:RimJ/RimL family protein N-acetyltransferase
LEPQPTPPLPTWAGRECAASPARPRPDRHRPLAKKIWDGIRRRLRKFCQLYYLFSLDLTTYDWPVGLPRDLVFRQATPEEFQALAADPAFEVSDYQLRNSLEIMAAGDQCWVAELDGRIGSYVFAQFKNRFFGPHCQVPVASDAVYLIRAVTATDLRGRRLAPATVAWLALKFKAVGYTRVLTDIAAHNRASLRYAEHAGYTRVASFLESTLGGRRRLLLCRGMRRVVSQIAERDAA